MSPPSRTGTYNPHPHGHPPCARLQTLLDDSVLLFVDVGRPLCVPLVTYDWERVDVGSLLKNLSPLRPKSFSVVNNPVV